MLLLPRSLAVFVLSLALPGSAVLADPADEVQAEALYEEGLKLQEAGQRSEAARRFRAAIEIDDKHAPSFVGLGHIHLRQGELKEAERAFKQALRKKKRYAPAFNGLGLVYREKKNELRRAIGFFRDAVRADKAYSEGQYNLAQTLQQYGSSETLRAYRNVVKIDPAHPDALFQIGRIHETNEDYAGGETAYRGQIDVNAKHYGARLRLGMMLNLQGRSDEAMATFEGVAAIPNPHRRYAVLELAGVHQRRRDYDRSQSLFEAYIEALDPEEQAIYHDLGLVAGGGALQRFETASAEEQKEISEAFWKDRDPAPATEANERLLEHYRRVAHAREHYGSRTYPWDDRGEAYIRYGEPDHVSRSRDIRLERGSKLVALKDRLIQRAGEAIPELIRDREEITGRGGSVADADYSEDEDPEGLSEGLRPQRIAREAELRGATILGWPVYPVAEHATWEYWIYTDVGPGIEVTFVQRQHGGSYEYAKMPLGTGRIARIWREMNPEVVIERIALRTPSRYTPDFAAGILDFAFYTAAFKASEETSGLEIYYGIPMRDLTAVPIEDGGKAVYLERGVAVYDASNREVHRMHQEMALRVRDVVDTSAGVFIPEVDRIELSPGSYRFAIQVVDRSSGKSQVYNHQRIVKGYGGESLMLSDIELAGSIEVADKGRFQKGDVAVIPMASRTYLSNQPVFIYYEIYNLTRDEFGATNYRVSYEVRSMERKSVGARILGGFGNLLGKREDRGTITIEYEQIGAEVNEQGYLELDMSQSEPGRQLLRIKVTDRNSGKSARAVARFTIQD